MELKLKTISAALALVLLATPGFGAPTIVHDPIKVAEKGQPLGVKATVRDTAARVETVSLFYASSRGMTPGHMMGPGAQMFYYIQAENADGEVRDTDWQTVKLVESGVAPEAIPSASSVARKAQQQAAPAAQGTTAAPAPAKSGKSKYLLPAAVIVGGGLAIGGALAIATYDSGGGGDGDDNPSVDGNYGGNYDVCFVPAALSNAPAATTCDDGLVNVYVTNGSARIVGLWEATVLTAPLNGNLFSAVENVGATAKFPEAHLIASGEISGNACTVRIDGYSTDAAGAVGLQQAAVAVHRGAQRDGPARARRRLCPRMVLEGSARDRRLHLAQGSLDAVPRREELRDGGRRPRDGPPAAGRRRTGAGHLLDWRVRSGGRP